MVAGMSLHDFNECDLATALRVIEADRRQKDDQMVALYRVIRWQTAILANASGNLRHNIRDPKELMKLPGDKEHSTEMTGNAMFAELMKAAKLMKDKK